jgi:hypothetical protein
MLVLDIKPGILYMLSSCSTIQRHPQPPKTYYYGASTITSYQILASHQLNFLGQKHREEKELGQGHTACSVAWIYIRDCQNPKPKLFPLTPQNRKVCMATNSPLILSLSAQYYFFELETHKNPSLY